MGRECRTNPPWHGLGCGRVAAMPPPYRSPSHATADLFGIHVPSVTRKGYAAITSDLIGVVCKSSRLAITNGLSSVFCWVSQMASSHISGFIRRSTFGRSWRSHVEVRDQSPVLIDGLADHLHLFAQHHAGQRAFGSLAEGFCLL